MIAVRPTLLALCFCSATLQAQVVLDFSTSLEGFVNSGSPGGTLVRASDTGSGSLRLTNPAAWTWRAAANFNKTGSGKAREVALALGNAGSRGGFLRFDLILRPTTARTGATSGFWGVDYLVGIQQSIPGGGDGWVQKIAYHRPSTTFPPASETTIAVTVPLRNWAETTSELRIHPESSSYDIYLGSSSGGVAQVEWHIDNLRIEASPAGAIPLEAENATLTGVLTATTASGYQGSGYVTGFDQAGDQLSWNFTAPAGVHRLRIRYRSPGGIKGFSGSLNGSGFSGYFPAAGSFSSYDAGLVELSAGSNTLTLGGGWNFYEIDSATLTAEVPPAAPAPGPAIPVDAAATPAARSLLASIASNYGVKTFSGQHEAGDLAHIQAVSGKLPAIFAGDLIEYSPTRVARAGLPAGYSESLVTKAGEGHLLSVLWHWNAPSGLLDTPAQPWWRGFYTEASTFDLAAALANPSGTEYGQILRDIDAIAVQLRKFDQANIPVLFRPLHEAEGGWFWWGAKGPDAFKQLWRLLFSRLTQHHGLHHLLWVLTVEDPGWYPGNDVVDILGVDAYPDDRSDALLTRWEPLRARFDGVKPIALTEFGGVPDIEKMQRLGVWWAWFASWHGSPYGPQSMPAATVQRIYQSAAVITRDELAAPARLDANGDGVLDSEAAALGFAPTFDLRPTIAFFRTNAERFDLGHSQADLDAARLAGRQEILAAPNVHGLYTASQLRSLAISQPFLSRNPANGTFALHLGLKQSTTLTDWAPVVPTGVNLRPGGILEVTLPASGDAAFYRVLGEAP